MSQRRGSHVGNVSRDRFVGRPARGAQNPLRPRALELGPPAATRPTPSPIEATAIRARRSSLLGVALQAVGWVARGAPPRSPRDRDSLAPAGLPRFLDLEVSPWATGRPPVSSELAELVRTMAPANPLWALRASTVSCSSSGSTSHSA